jgi:glyoxylase-like metal-dependent hydrolase (beta-lactamase superfamily II)
MKPATLHDTQFEAPPGGFVNAIKPDDLVYFCCNVGDADAQVVLLPTGADGIRRLIIVDIGVSDKVPHLLDDLETHGLVSFQDEEEMTIALVIATHPHNDHIAGMAQFLQKYGPHVAEFWDPGFFHTSASYAQMLQQIQRLPKLVYSQPTSGLRRFFPPVALTVLSPSIHLRNRTTLMVSRSTTRRFRFGWSTRRALSPIGCPSAVARATSQPTPSPPP